MSSSIFLVVVTASARPHKILAFLPFSLRFSSESVKSEAPAKLPPYVRLPSPATSYPILFMLPLRAFCSLTALECKGFPERAADPASAATYGSICT